MKAGQASLSPGDMMSQVYGSRTLVQCLTWALSLGHAK